jgi:hypothetical protein
MGGWAVRVDAGGSRRSRLATAEFSVLAPTDDTAPSMTLSPLSLQAAINDKAAADFSTSSLHRYTGMSITEYGAAMERVGPASETLRVCNIAPGSQRAELELLFADYGAGGWG